MDQTDVDAIIEETAKDAEAEAAKFATEEAAKAVADETVRAAAEEAAKGSAGEVGKENGDCTDSNSTAGAPGAAPVSKPSAAREKVVDDQPSSSIAPL